MMPCIVENGTVISAPRSGSPPRTTPFDLLAQYPRGTGDRRVHIYYYYGMRSPQNQSVNGLLGPTSIMVVYMDPLGRLAFGITWGLQAMVPQEG